MREVNLSVFIIAFNEENKIGDAIKSIKWADEIVVVDSNSTDRTAAIATELGARVVQEQFSGFGNLRNSAIKHCRYEWILSLDADERCTEKVKSEVIEILLSKSSLDAYFIPRKNFFMGKWIRFSGWYPNYRQPQLFKSGRMIYDDLPVHEGYRLLGKGRPGHLKNFIIQVPFADVGEVLRKADRYSTLGAKKIINRRISVPIAFWHGAWSFIKHYFFKLGMLDGGPGFVIALGNFEGTFYRYLKAKELRVQNVYKIPKP